MPRIDDYIAACRLAREKLAPDPCARIAARSGFALLGGGALEVPFLDRVYHVSCPGFEFADRASTAAQVPLQEQVLILHYLTADAPVAVTGHWVAYREIPGAAFYFAAFVKRAVDPLKKRFGQDIDGFRTASARLQGTGVEGGDAAAEFRVLPNVPVRLILHGGDEEFPPEATILFERSAGRILTPEDAAWLAGMLVYRLIRLASG
jgi:hypothetical protein